MPIKKPQAANRLRSHCFYTQPAAGLLAVRVAAPSLVAVLLPGLGDGSLNSSFLVMSFGTSFSMYSDRFFCPSVSLIPCLDDFQRRLVPLDNLHHMVPVFRLDGISHNADLLIESCLFERLYPLSRVGILIEAAVAAGAGIIGIFLGQSGPVRSSRSLQLSLDFQSALERVSLGTFLAVSSLETDQDVAYAHLSQAVLVLRKILGDLLVRHLGAHHLGSLRWTRK